MQLIPKLKSIITILLTLSVLVSCKENGPVDVITLQSSRLEFPFLGGEQSITYFATQPPVVQIAPKWVVIELLDDKLVVSTTVNTQTGARTADVKIICGDNATTLTVRQAADPRGVPLQTLDSLALVAIYNSCGGASWTMGENMTRWNLDKPFNQWSGVRSEFVDGQRRVYAISLNSVGATGELPPEIVNLSRLSELALSFSFLEGSPFEYLSKIASLTSLDLSSNLLSEPITQDLSAMSNLVYLNLSGNRFEGPLPENISQLKSLRYLTLGVNVFTGGVPSQYLNMQDLVYLDLSGNRLSGSFPEVVTRLPNLTRLNLSDNDFEGVIPGQIANLTKLTELILYQNRFSGTVPPGIGQMGNLEQMNIGSNALTGALPSDLGELHRLVSLNIAGNHFTSLHPTIEGNSALEWIDISFNQIGTIPAGLGRLVNLKFMAANDNVITTLPDISALTALEDVYLDNNMLSDIPVGIEKCSSLKSIIIRNNKLRKLPSTLQNMTWLETLDLSNNKIVAIVPTWIGKMSELHSLNLSNNDMIGSIPAEIVNARKLMLLTLSGNRLTGEIPSKVLLDKRWKGETYSVIPEVPPFTPITITQPGVWMPQYNICPQKRGAEGELTCGFSNCGFTHQDNDNDGGY